ncbi:hypothetical protein SEA_JFLIX2_54 [Rhodococcus phage Jflix2]|nr:hypothetical protein SEA_JFLIX2_54 [Rhodococcus phage Jflix2]
MIPPQLLQDPAARQRLLREARALSVKPDRTAHEQRRLESLVRYLTPPSEATTRSENTYSNTVGSSGRVSARRPLYYSIVRAGLPSLGK